MFEDMILSEPLVRHDSDIRAYVPTTVTSGCDLQSSQGYLRDWDAIFIVMRDVQAVKPGRSCTLAICTLIVFSTRRGQDRNRTRNPKRLRFLSVNSNNVCRNWFCRRGHDASAPSFSKMLAGKQQFFVMNFHVSHAFNFLNDRRGQEQNVANFLLDPSICSRSFLNRWMTLIKKVEFLLS